MSVSFVVRKHGISPSLLFNWRRRMAEGGREAVRAVGRDHVLPFGLAISPDRRGQGLVHGGEVTVHFDHLVLVHLEILRDPRGRVRCQIALAELIFSRRKMKNSFLRPAVAPSVTSERLRMTCAWIAARMHHMA